MGFQYNRNNRWQFYGYYTTPTRELVGLNAGTFELGIQLRTVSNLYNVLIINVTILLLQVLYTFCQFSSTRMYVPRDIYILSNITYKRFFFYEF